MALGRSAERSGEGAALNQESAKGPGDMLCFVNAGGLFAGGTAAEKLREFNLPNVDAAATNALSTYRAQTRMLTVFSRIGTGWSGWR